MAFLQTFLFQYLFFNYLVFLFYLYPFLLMFFKKYTKLKDLTKLIIFNILTFKNIFKGKINQN